MDLESMNYYSQGVEDGKRQQEAAKNFSKGTGSFLSMIATLLFVSFIYSSSLFVSYFILRETNFFTNLQGWEKFIAVLMLAYLISSFVFFLKGIMIVFKKASRWLWVVIWVICFTFVCLLPAVAVYFILENMLGPSIPAKREGISHYQFWSLAGAIIAGGIIYNKYGLNRDSALKISNWAYQLGKSTATKWLP
jgi:hypothetical protein